MQRNEEAYASSAVRARSRIRSVTVPAIHHPSCGAKSASIRRERVFFGFSFVRTRSAQTRTQMQ